MLYFNLSQYAVSLAGPYSTFVGSMDILVEKQGHVLSATIMIKFVCGMRLTLKGLEFLRENND